MSAGVVFFFEENDLDVWSGRPIDLDAWRYCIKAAGDIDQVIIVNKTNEKLHFDDAMNVKIVSELPELPGQVLYVICPWDKTTEKEPIWTLDHFGIDWYVFGPANGWSGKEIKRGVFIPVPNGLSFHSVHAATVIMTHRRGFLDGLTSIKPDTRADEIAQKLLHRSDS